jgi:hypothetical protein
MRRFRRASRRTGDDPMARSRSRGSPTPCGASPIESGPAPWRHHDHSHPRVRSAPNRRSATSSPATTAWTSRRNTATRTAARIAVPRRPRSARNMHGDYRAGCATACVPQVMARPGRRWKEIGINSIDCAVQRRAATIPLSVRTRKSAPRTARRRSRGPLPARRPRATPGTPGV